MENIRSEYQNYSLFRKVFKNYTQAGIEGIDPNAPLMIELDQLMEENNQLFYISDAILLDILFVSKSIKTVFGIGPKKVSPGYFLTTTHPEDLNRHHLARAKLISMAQELFIQKKGSKIISTNVRARKSDDIYFNALYQAFLFYSEVPYESVYLILVITDISGFANIHKGFHFYNGNDQHLFRFPDDNLLLLGNIFSHTEFKIIELIEEGLSSKEIAQKLFRSVYTINTHRTNILKKSGCSTMGEVIRDLKEKGLL